MSTIKRTSNATKPCTTSSGKWYCWIFITTIWTSIRSFECKWLIWWWSHGCKAIITALLQVKETWISKSWNLKLKSIILIVGPKKHPSSQPVFLKSATQTRHGFLRFGIVGCTISFLYTILSITFFFHLHISQLTLRWQLHGNLGLQKLFADFLHNRFS